MSRGQLRRAVGSCKRRQNWMGGPRLLYKGLLDGAVIKELDDASREACKHGRRASYRGVYRRRTLSGGVCKGCALCGLHGPVPGSQPAAHGARLLSRLRVACCLRAWCRCQLDPPAAALQ